MRHPSTIYGLLAALFLGLFCLNATATTYYVDVNSPNPTPPYTSWSTASTDIQSAVNQTVNGDLVLVNPGVYRSGGYIAPDGTLSCVVVSNAVTLQSINGNAVTLINGNGTMRGIYLGTGAVLAGFTLTNGNAGTGGGAYLGTLTNCTLSGNSAQYGGGVYYSTANNCMFSNNSAIGNYGYYYGFGGGAIYSTLNNCIVSGNSANGVPGTIYGNGYGGGAYGTTLNNCIVSSNSAYGYNNTGCGGGAYGGTLNNCLVTGNSATLTGGGAMADTLNNCTVSGNSVSTYYVIGLNGKILPPGGGVFSVTIENCIVYNNSAVGNQNPNYSSSTLNFCCTTPLPTNGLGNIANEPLFENPATGDFHLQSNSPCINAGNNAYVKTSTDLDGNPRIVGGTVDIGAYEYQTPVSMVSYYWLEQYGLSITNNIDTSSPNGTAFDVYQDWIAGLNPTNPASILAMLPPTNNVPGVIVRWQSVSGIPYNLQRSTNLSTQPPFSTIQSNITGQAGTTSYTDTTATNSTPYFYRVGVP